MIDIILVTVTVVFIKLAINERIRSANVSCGIIIWYEMTYPLEYVYSMNV